MERISEVTDLKLDEIIEYLNRNCEEYNPALDNTSELFEQYGIDKGYWEIMQECGDMIESKGGLEDFLEEYYRYIIKDVCNIVKSYKKD